MDWSELLASVVNRHSMLTLRSVFLLGSLFILCWVFVPRWLQAYRVKPPGQLKAYPLKEAILTNINLFIFILAGTVAAIIKGTTGYTMMYLDVDDYGVPYLIGSIFLFVFLSDTTFYWAHLLMHKNKWVYKSHATHHKFINVTPWAAYAFHVGEGFIHAFSFFVMIMILPWHPIAIIAHSYITIGYNGFIHCGYDFMPRTWRTHIFLKWLNTPTHHIYHHQKFDCNYGFVFTFWDKVMGTERLPEAYWKNQPVADPKPILQNT